MERNIDVSQVKAIGRIMGEQRLCSLPVCGPQQKAKRVRVGTGFDGVLKAIIKLVVFSDIVKR